MKSDECPQVMSPESVSVRVEDCKSEYMPGDSGARF